MELKRMGARVLHDVDATEMKSHTYLKLHQFDRIVFNFPHAGFAGRETMSHVIKYEGNLPIAVLS
jgi:25S rRNA (uracil2634-N3)-methyltransferase